MQDSNSWEVVVSSVINQLKNIEATLESQNSSVEEYLSRAKNKAEGQLLEAQLRSTQTSFERMENKLQDMIIYLCRAMTVSKVHKLSNLLEEVDHGVEQ
jgi:hypothetical protein